MYILETKNHVYGSGIFHFIFHIVASAVAAFLSGYFDDFYHFKTAMQTCRQADIKVRSGFRLRMS